MRSSSREAVLEAAVAVVDERNGDITYESVAKQAGLTKAGVMYHFATKEEMMVAVIEHVIDRWQDELLSILGRPLEGSTLRERVRAYIQFAGEGGVTVGEFAVFAEAVRRPALSQPWLEYLQRWFAFDDDADSAPLLLAWLAVNGMWIAESTEILQMGPAQRAAILKMLESLLEESDR